LERLSIHCPHCGGTDVSRIRRGGPADTILGWLGRWPWRCRACLATFHARQRLVPVRLPEPVRQPVECRRKHTEPSAAVLVRASSPQQLENILLALHEAVRREQELPADEPAERANR
jgi:hypothetical protein